MRENSRRGAPRSARPADRLSANRDARGRGAADRGAGRSGAGRSNDGRWRAGGQGSGAPGAGRDGGKPDGGGRTGTQPSPDAARLTALLEPVLHAMQLDLEAVRITSAGRRRLLRVIVDGDGGVSLDDIAEVSREISARLDAKDAMGDQPYTLEVSSPGVDRPLTLPRHWRRAVGRLVTVSVRAGDSARPSAAGSVQARVVGADERGVTLDVAGAERRFGFDQLGPGRVQIEFGHLDEADDLDAVEEEPDGY